MSLSGATTPDQSGPGSNGTIEERCILQISEARVSPSDGFMSYLGHSLAGFYPSVEMQSVYSTAQAKSTSENYL